MPTCSLLYGYPKSTMSTVVYYGYTFSVVWLSAVYYGYLQSIMAIPIT